MLIWHVDMVVLEKMQWGDSIKESISSKYDSNSYQALMSLSFMQKFTLNLI